MRSLMRQTHCPRVVPNRQCAHRCVMGRNERTFNVMPSTASRHSGYPALDALKTGHGNDRVWKAMKPAFHPSHTLWKSLWDSHIPTATTTGYVFSCIPHPES